MASRAFFRCRACGEPVVAGAFRCPVCGIDFPAGERGVPQDPLAPATEPAPPADHRDRLAAVLSAALEPEVDTAPNPDGAAVPQPADQPRSRLVPARDREPSDAEAPSTSISTSPQSVPSEDRPDEAAATADGSRLAVTPVRTVRRKRVEPRSIEDTPPIEVEARPPQRLERAASPPARRHRPLNDALSTLFTAALVGLVAVVLLAELGPGTRVAPAAGTAGGPGLSTEVQVGADDGWVTLPGQFNSASIVGTGTVRVRIGSEVFTVPAGRTVQASPAPGEIVSVRVVRAPATATVRIQQR